jgi:AraC-like DNA-binding protein
MKARAGYWVPPPRSLPGLPELVYAGHIESRVTTRIDAHRHDCWELCLIESGRTRWIIGDRAIEASGGQLVVIPPHAAHEGWQPGRYRFLGLRARAGAPLLGLPREQARCAVTALAAAAGSSRPLLADLRPAWKRLERAWVEGTSVAAIAARAALLEIVAAIAAGEIAAGTIPPLVARALDEFTATDQFLPLTTLAARLRCSPNHLKNAFRRATGLPPAEHHRRQRIARAWRELHRGGRSVTDIAYAYGFPSSQHFATAFKRVTGLTPSAARGSSAPDLEDSRTEPPPGNVQGPRIAHPQSPPRRTLGRNRP